MALTGASLGPIHAVFLSHAHTDHLDPYALVRLWRELADPPLLLLPATLRFLLPLFEAPPARPEGAAPGARTPHPGARRRCPGPHRGRRPPGRARSRADAGDARGVHRERHRSVFEVLDEDDPRGFDPDRDTAPDRPAGTVRPGSATPVRGRPFEAYWANDLEDRLDGRSDAFTPFFRQPLPARMPLLSHCLSLPVISYDLCYRQIALHFERAARGQMPGSFVAPLVQG